MFYCCVQGILADKDGQIVDLRQQIMRLRDDLNVASMDADRKSVAVLSKVINNDIFVLNILS